jgi:hypothetical protein
MPAWHGLDPGGTEQLWHPNVLLGALQTMKSHEPFSRNTFHAPIFGDLEQRFPSITWRARDRHGSFRPIFRRTNPWEKLGLVTPGTANISVTAIGNDLLSVKTTLQDIFIEATKNYSEQNGTRPFGIMCAAALELPSTTFSLEDVEFVISQRYDPRADNLSGLLGAGRRGTFPAQSRRPRTLRSFMAALENADALIKVGTNGWRLKDRASAFRIAHTAGTSLAAPAATVAPPAPASAPAPPSFRVIEEGARATPTFSPSSFHAADPEKRALLLEKATATHEAIIEKLARNIRELGGTPLEDPDSFDVATSDLKPSIFEVKTINSSNAISQMRKAVAQLPEYRWRHRQTFDAETTLVIVTSEDPRNHLDSDYIEFLANDRSLVLLWEDEERFIDRHGRTLREILVPAS